MLLHLCKHVGGGDSYYNIRSLIAEALAKGV